MKFLPRLVLSSLLIGPMGCASNLETIVNKKPAVGQNLILQKEVPPLYVNTSKEHYALEKSREEGEKNLFDLTMSEDQEEAWVFVEYLDGRKIWYENGIEFEGNNDLIGIGKQSLIEVIKNKENIKWFSLYHFHPVDINSNYDRLQTPSLFDFKGFYITLKQINDALLEPDKGLMEKMDFKIVVSTGIYTVRFNNRTLNDDEAENELAKIIYNIFLTRSISVTDEHDEFDYSQSNRSNFAEVNEQFAKKFNSELMYFDFEPRKYY